MNAQRRKAIDALVLKVEALEADISTLLSGVEEAREEANTLAEEETEYRDNMPESLQNGEKGEQANGAIENLETARDALQELEDALNAVDLTDINSTLESAKGE